MENQNYEHHQEYPEYNHGKKKIKNPWQTSAIVLGIVTVILLVLSFSGGISRKVTGNVISGDEAGKELVKYLNQKTNGGRNCWRSNE